MSTKTSRKEAIFIPVVIFLLVFSTRLVDINKPAEMWDEITSYVVGLQFYYNIANLDFNPDSWKISAHPPIARYMFGAANGIYVFSNIGFELFSLGQTDSIKILHDLKNFVPGRLTSAFFASFTAVLIFILTRKFINTKTGIIASFILAFSPAFLAYSRLAQPDAITIFFYTLSVSLFLIAIKENKYKYYMLSAISTGLTLGSKLNTATLFILLPLIFFVYNKDKLRKLNLIGYVKLIILPLVAIFTFYITWPRIWTNTIANFLETIELQSFVSTSPEYFLGGLDHPFYYYATHFIVGTPVFLLLLLIPAGAYIHKNRDKFHVSLILWIIVHLAIFSFSILKQTGIKNTLVAYPALAIIASLGVVYLADRLKPYMKNKSIHIVGGIVLAYLIATAYLMHPYYLDYYNEAVGGPKNVYENRLFAFGSLGEGISEAADYLNENKNGTIQFYVMPRHVIPTHNLQEINSYVPDYLIENGIVENTTDNNIWIMRGIVPVADYLVENTNYRWYIDPGFHQAISNDYKLIHTVEVQGAPLAWIYEKN